HKDPVMKELLKAVAILSPDESLKTSLTSAFARSPGCKPNFYSTADIAMSDFKTTGNPSLLVVDWAQFSINRHAMFFQRLRKLKNGANIQVLVISPELTDQLLAMTSEYGVTKLLLVENIGKSLQDILRQ